MRIYKLIGAILGLGLAQSICSYITIWVAADRVVPVTELSISKHGLLFLPVVILLVLEIYAIINKPNYSIRKLLDDTLMQLAKMFFILIGGALIAMVLQAVWPVTSEWLQTYFYSFVGALLYGGLVVLPLYIFLTPMPKQKV